MARTNNLTDFLTDVSSAIKQKTGDDTPIPASEFDTEILSIETAGNYQSKTLNITQNGNYNLLPDQEFDAISNVNISVSVNPVLQNKTITENGSYTADQNYDGLGTVIVNVQGSTINNQDKEITANGTYTADEGYTGLGTVTVNVPSESNIEPIYSSLGYITPASLKLNGNICNGYARSFYPYTIVTFQNTEGYFLLDFSGEDYELRAFSSEPTPGIAGTVIGVYNNCIYVWTKETIYVYDITTTELVKSISIPSSRQGSWGFGMSNFGFVGNPTNGSRAVNQLNPMNDSFTTMFSVNIVQSVFPDSFYASFANNELGILNRNADDSSARIYATIIFDYKTKKYYTLNKAYFQGISEDLSLCFINGNVYQCSVSGSNIAVGSLVKSNVITKNVFIYNVKDDIYVVSGSYSLSGSTSYIYQFDKTTYTFSLLQTFVNSVRNILCTTNGPIIGYNANGIPFYLPTDTDAVNSGNVLTGQTVYTAVHQMITGTMPDNGELNYTPSTEDQTIPEGYTSGGVISAVDASIDENIKAENIKKDITVLGVTGTYEPDYTELGTISPTEYDTAVATSEDILGITTK